MSTAYSGCYVLHCLLTGNVHHVQNTSPQTSFFSNMYARNVTLMCMIQFAKAVYSENSLKLSILVKMLHNIFRHNTDYVIYSGVCFAACLPATVLHDLLRDKFLVS